MFSMGSSTDELQDNKKGKREIEIKSIVVFMIMI